MIVTSDILKENMENISNKNTKISRDLRDEKIFKIKNGLYETDKNTPGYLLAGAIYSPSYLSFEYALSFYGLIPEGVKNYTSATFRKKKKKRYTNYFGTYLYRDVPASVYPYEVLIFNENGYDYKIASKEKALCDKLYTLSPLHNIDELECMLFEDLRIDEEEFNTLNINIIEKLKELYHSTNIKLLYKYMKRREKGE